MNIQTSGRSFAAIVKARTMEFLRDRGTFIWNLIFPVIMVFGFAFAFSGGANDAVLTVGTFGTAPDDFSLFQLSGIEQIDYQDRSVSIDEALQKLRRHQMDMLIDFDSGGYYINSESPSADIARSLISSPGAPQNAELTEEQVEGRAIRYVDWVVPGIVGMNMMFSCLFGVGFVLVRYRKNGVLKRMKATPVTPLTFVSAQAASRLIIVIVTSVIVYIGTNLALKFMMNGSYLDLFIITVLAIISMISLGLVFASRFKSEEMANGVLNLVTFPMIILSGVFFSLEDAPAFIRSIAKVFPLTHFIDGARAIMIDGAGLGQILPNLLYLAIFSLVMLIGSSLLFRWE